MEIRSFLAFELPADIRQTLSAVSGAGRSLPLNVRWVRVENIHLTIVFMGNIQEARIKPVGEAASTICDQYAPFCVQVGEIGMFGNRRHPRVVWVGLRGDLDRMSSFRDDLQRCLAPFGVKEERRPFKPHLTLGRFRKGAKADSGLDAFLSKYQDLNGPECLLRELVLFRSDLKPGGAVYTRLGAWALRG